MTERHDSMRGWFAAELYDAMAEDDRIWLLTGDLGWGMLDKIKSDFPNRFLNCGAAETAMMGIAAGLAIEGKIPFVYSITTFLLFRPFEWIRNYVNHESIPVRLVGSGMNDDYAHDGITHQPWEAREVLKLFPNIAARFPEDKRLIPNIVKTMVEVNVPSFLCLRR